MNKIALVLTRTLGDVVLIHNLVDSICEKYPGVEIDVYVDEMYLDIVTGNPKISKIKTSPQWLQSWSEIIDLVIGDDYFDVLIPQQLSLEDTIWHQLDEYRHQHLLDYYLLRSHLPRRSEGTRLKLFSTPEDEIVVNNILASAGVKDKTYVVLHTTSGVPTKDWDNFGVLALKLINRNTSIIQVGSLADKDLDISEVSLDLRGKLSFSQISVICSKSKCFVGLDSGLSYVSAAGGGKTIVLQGSTVPETSGPFGDNVVNILSETLPQCEAKRCHTNCRYTNETFKKCISNILVDEVLTSIEGETNG